MDKVYGIFVLILILILFCCVPSISAFTSITSKLYNGEKWAKYRIGDVYMLDKNTRMYDPAYFDNILYHKDSFPGTIANEYMNKNNTPGKNKELLQSIIEKRITDKKVYPDTLFLHIRVGDVLCDKSEWLTEVDGPRHYSKVGDTIWWDNVLKYNKQNGITKVVIIAGSHLKNCLQESEEYIKDRTKFLEDNNLKVSYRLGQSPDEDIIMCYYVKHFTTTGGGYGNLIKEIKKISNTILDDLYKKFGYKFEKNNNFTDLELVDCVYCVVMPQRKEYMKGIFNSMKLNYTFFNAITPKDISENDYNTLSKTNDPNSKLWKHPTRLPLQLSFTMCYLDAIKKGYKHIVIFEDDIIVKVDTQTLVNYINEFIKKPEYVFFYMGYCWMDCKQKFTIDRLVEVPDKQLYCCHAICYKVKYLDELINSMYPMNDNLDNNIVNFIKNKNYKVCVPTSTLFDQNRSEFGTLNDDDNPNGIPDCNKTFKS
jgi:GR25 family glycosyltransferase involved in LPS biosynthesis